MMASPEANRERPVQRAVLASDDDGDFFDFPLANLRDKPNPLLNLSSSSDEEDLSSGHSDTENDHPYALNDDFCSALQRQFSSFNLHTNSNSNHRHRQPSVVPSKYLFDETGRRWSTKLCVSDDPEPFPRPKHQDGRSKCFPKSPAVRQTALLCWQCFVPDGFLQTHILPWFNQESVNGQRVVEPAVGKQTGRGKYGKDKMADLHAPSDMVTMDHLKAFLALLYARAASVDFSLPLEDSWNGDPFTPPFFTGTMDKETFFQMLKNVTAVNQERRACGGGSNSLPAFLNEFNYRLSQSFDPGDTLTVFDRTLAFNWQLGNHATTPSREDKPLTRKALISWLRDARCGFFLKVSNTWLNSPPNNVIGATNCDSSKLTHHTDETLHQLLGHPPIAGSGRTIYMSPTHSGVDSTYEMYRKHKLRVVGQLPSSGFFDCRVPFLAKGRSLLKRNYGSSIFLFDYPLTLISYQSRPVGRTPALIVSTAHLSKDKTDWNRSNYNHDQVDAQLASKQPPQAWVEYQQFMNKVADPMKDFCAFFVNGDNINNMPLERMLFFDCLYAAAFNAFVIWKLQLPKHDEKVAAGSTNFKAFLRTLACQLARPYVTKRLSSADIAGTATDNVWRSAAMQILRDSEEMRAGERITADTPKMASTDGSVVAQSTANDEAVTVKKQQKKQPRRRGKCKK